MRHGILRGQETSRIVADLNRFIYEHFSETELFLSFFAARIDLTLRTIAWSGAGHPPPLRVRATDRQVTSLESQNVLIGVVEDNLEAVASHTLQLSVGDRLVFYTDGVSETRDGAGRYLGTAGLSEIAAASSSVGLFDMADHVLVHVEDYREGAAEDDETLIVAEIR